MTLKISIFCQICGKILKILRFSENCVFWLDSGRDSRRNKVNTL